MLGSLKSVLTGVEREAWIRFGIAIVGLVLAFASAMLSTVSREAGNLLATAVLASAALLLAGIVGVATVPYLARRAIVRRVREAFDYNVTREGIVYVVLTLLIGIAALNTGNNLHFLVVAAMLGAVVVSGAASALMLKGLELHLSLPPHIFAERKLAARVGIRNSRKFFPAFSVSVVPPRADKRKRRLEWHRATFTFPPDRPGRRVWFRWPDLTIRLVQATEPPPEIIREPVYFPFIPSGESTPADVELMFERRGRYVQSGLGISTRFPFSFLVKTRRVPLAREIIVYPRVDGTDELFEILPMITGEFESYVRGRGYDLYRIREYTQEDSARHVDWKATAKSGSLKVREFTREDERKLRIVFDNPKPAEVSEKAYESAVAMTASLSWHFSQEGTELSFAANGYGGSADVYDFLEYLALVKPREESSVLSQLKLTDDYNLVVTARQRGSIPNALWQSSYFVFIGQ